MSSRDELGLGKLLLLAVGVLKTGVGLRSRSIPGLDQEVYALLTAYQALIRAADDAVAAVTPIPRPRPSRAVGLGWCHLPWAPLRRPRSTSTPPAATASMPPTAL
ncbi:hypothetical protein EDD99_6415 [Streptomyces sp. 846.5]|nr:hypothetical protein EDD99_6415 [Streptomyces sp. 846.5]